MSKTKEELSALKEEVESVTRKIRELTDEELEQVTGGVISPDSLINIRNEENYELNLFELPSDVMHSDVMKVIVESLNPDRDYPIPPIPFSD